MALKRQTQITLQKLVVRDMKSYSNPFADTPEAGLAENVIAERGRIERVPFAPNFHASAAASRVWKIVDFKFVRDSASESQCIIFKANGKVYKRIGGEEQEILPGKTSFSALAAKPSAQSIANRLHVSDGVQYLIWDGWDWFQAGLDPPASAPTTALVAGSLTGAYKVAVTAVHIRNAVRIHEGPRSPVTSVINPAAQNIRVTKPADLDSRATHWSIYISEIAGAGNRLRRAATATVNEATKDISADPATTAAFSPIRNDAPQPSRVLFQWKNRLGMGDRANVERFWFTAFEEVKAHGNGAPDESVPGRNTSSISDLVNSWTLPDYGEALRAGAWHENFAFLFSDRNGYVVQGEGGLLDSRAVRDFFPLHSFDFGAAGPWAVRSTPYGLVVFTPERRLYLWAGGKEVTDIGHSIQRDLDTISDADLFDTELVRWEGNGRDWLLLISPGLSKMYIYNFSALIGENRGAWFHYTPASSTVSTGATYRESGLPYLLLGMADGSVQQFDAECQPAHLGFTFTLGKVYLGSAVQNSPATTIRTAHNAPQPSRFLNGKYLLVKHRLKGASEANAISATDPVVKAYYDRLAPDASGEPASGITLTLGSRLPNEEQRIWLKPSAAASAAGARAKQYTFELSWPAGADRIATGGRDQFFNNELLGLAFAFQPLDLMAE
jgi:hypothetical protein